MRTRLAWFAVALLGSYPLGMLIGWLIWVRDVNRHPVAH